MLNEYEKEKLEKLKSFNISQDRIAEMQEKIKGKTPLEIHIMIDHSTYDRNTLDYILLQNDLQMYREIIAIDLACWKHTTEVLSGIKLQKGDLLPSFDEYPPELMAQIPKDNKFSVVNENIKKLLNNNLSNTLESFK